MQVSAEFKYIYFNELGWYIAGIVNLFVEPPKKDFLEFLVHHIITIGLIVGSYVAVRLLFRKTKFN